MTTFLPAASSSRGAGSGHVCLCRGFHFRPAGCDASRGDNPRGALCSVRSTKKTEAIMMFSGVTGKSEGREAPLPRLLMSAHTNP